MIVLTASVFVHMFSCLKTSFKNSIIATITPGLNAVTFLHVLLLFNILLSKGLILVLKLVLKPSNFPLQSNFKKLLA